VLSPKRLASASASAAHGRYNKKTAEYFQEALGGQLIKLRNLDIVPQLNAIRDAGQ
jgi:hypothetical protein